MSPVIRQSVVFRRKENFMAFSNSMEGRLLSIAFCGDVRLCECIFYLRRARIYCTTGPSTMRMQMIIGKLDCLRGRTMCPTCTRVQLLLRVTMAKSNCILPFVHFGASAGQARERAQRVMVAYHKES
jgi:hypothetical protein